MSELNAVLELDDILGLKQKINQQQQIYDKDLVYSTNSRDELNDSDIEQLLNNNNKRVKQKVLNKTQSLFEIQLNQIEIESPDKRQIQKNAFTTHFDSDSSESFQVIQKRQIKKQQQLQSKKNLKEQQSQSTYKPKCPSTDESQQSSSSSDQEIPIINKKPIEISSSSEEAFKKKYDLLKRRQKQVNLIPKPKQKEVVHKTNNGSFRYQDKLKEVLNIRKDIHKLRIEFFVSWQQRKEDGKTPFPGWVTENDLKNHEPVMLSKYLLAKIKWPK